MRLALSLLGFSALVLTAGAARAEHVCTSFAPDPAIMVALRVADDGKVQGGEVHWAVPNDKPDQPSMVHIVYPLDGDHAATRPTQVITMNAVTGRELTRSPTASVQIVVDGMEMAVRAWDLYGQAVEQIAQKSTADGLKRASFVGAVTFTPSYQDGRRDVDSTQALNRISKGASTLQVRLLGEDGLAMQDHTYRLFSMPAPAMKDVQAALAQDLQKARDLSSCQSY